jgi:hypothetical protein
MTKPFDPTLYAVTAAAVPTLLGLLQTGGLLKQQYPGNKVLAIVVLFLAALGLGVSLVALGTQESGFLYRWAALAGIGALGVWVFVPTLIFVTKWPGGTPRK